MTTKTFCDICGKEFDKLAMEMKSHAGTFTYFGRVVVLEHDDFCGECGAKVKDAILKLKEEARTEP